MQKFTVMKKITGKKIRVNHNKTDLKLLKEICIGVRGTST